MPNNTQRIYCAPYPYHSQVPYIDAQQQPFGSATTLINGFYNNATFPITSSAGAFNIIATTASALTASVDVSDYNSHVFQIGMTGSGTVNTSVLSTIDGYNWTSEFSVSLNAVTSSITRISGRRRYFQVSTSTTAPATGSVYLLSGQ